MTMDSHTWDWAQFWTYLQKIALAYLISFPLGWEREREAQSVGLRTFPIVGMASCGYVLIAQAVMDAAGLSRLLQGLVAGIGFIGGGAIVKHGLTVTGTAAAASIWNTGAIGAAVALGYYEIAVPLALINVLSLRLLKPIKEYIDRHRGPEP